MYFSTNKIRIYHVFHHWNVIRILTRISPLEYNPYYHVFLHSNIIRIYQIFLYWNIIRIYQVFLHWNRIRIYHVFLQYDVLNRIRSPGEICFNVINCLSFNSKVILTRKQTPYYRISIIQDQLSFSSIMLIKNKDIYMSLIC